MKFTEFRRLKAVRNALMYLALLSALIFGFQHLNISVSDTNLSFASADIHSIDDDMEERIKSIYDYIRKTIIDGAIVQYGIFADELTEKTDNDCILNTATMLIFNLRDAHIDALYYKDTDIERYEAAKRRLRKALAAVIDHIEMLKDQYGNTSIEIHDISPPEVPENLDECITKEVNDALGQVLRGQISKFPCERGELN